MRLGCWCLGHIEHMRLRAVADWYAGMQGLRYCLLAHAPAEDNMGCRVYDEYTLHLVDWRMAMGRCAVYCAGLNVVTWLRTLMYWDY